MPGFNRRGPMGQGPMTGRKMGKCTDFGAKINKEEITSDEDQNQKQPENFQGRGFGFRGKRGGRGMGFQNRYRGEF